MTQVWKFYPVWRVWGHLDLGSVAENYARPCTPHIPFPHFRCDYEGNVTMRSRLDISKSRYTEKHFPRAQRERKSSRVEGIPGPSEGTAGLG